MDVDRSLPYSATHFSSKTQGAIIVANSAVGRLYVVATPIGNLGDFSPRGVDTLRSCGLIAAEDTRRTGTLLRHFEIPTPLLSLHDHNERQRTPELLARLQGGESIALVSDAGTPAISDPGFELVAAAAAAGIEIVAVPGPCAALAALSIAGLPTDRFCFEGFLPARGAARRARLDALSGEPRTLVFYESPHRIREMLEDCRNCFDAARRAAVARELTKLHETLYRGSLGELCARAHADTDFVRGEIVLVIEGAAPAATAPEDAELDRVLALLLAELPLKQAARLAAQILRVRDNEAYKRALQLKANSKAP
jgi:16S rRNA (cytidine1402-2'-O)-methyltransferase